jgi:hypothetical protein
MKTLALTALLCLLPRLCALTITHVGTSEATGGNSSSSFPLNFIWDFPQYRGATPLLSVSISTSYTAEVVSTQSNPTSASLVWQPSASVSPRGYWVSTVGGPGTEMLDYPVGLVASQAGESLVLAPQSGTVTYRATLGGSTSGVLLTNPTTMTYFTGNGSKRMNLDMTGVAATFYGSSSGSGVATFSVVYNTLDDARVLQSVHDAPDAGVSGLLFSFAFAAMIVLHRRNRHEPHPETGPTFR